MALIAVTAETEIEKCQDLLNRSLRKRLPKSDDLPIGFPGGTVVAKVHYDTDLWFTSVRHDDLKISRYWNAFGLKIQDRGPQTIVVEVNPPIVGFTRQVSGLIARDDKTGEYLLLHRGRIGGGRKGIGKSAFVDWYRGSWADVQTPAGDMDHAILVGLLGSPNVVDQIRGFVGEVAQFKDEVTSGKLSRTPRARKQSREFRPEFHGTRKGSRGRILEYECFHGLVVNKLAERERAALAGADANIFNSRSIDLGIEIGNELKRLYEVKSSANTQAVFTAIGQLMFHSAGKPSVEKTIVFPAGELGQDARKILSQLGINILEYLIQDGNVQFLR